VKSRFALKGSFGTSPTEPVTSVSRTSEAAGWSRSTHTGLPLDVLGNEQELVLAGPHELKPCRHHAAPAVSACPHRLMSTTRRLRNASRQCRPRPASHAGDPGDLPASSRCRCLELRSCPAARPRGRSDHGFVVRADGRVPVREAHRASAPACPHHGQGCPEPLCRPRRDGLRGRCHAGGRRPHGLDPPVPDQLPAPAEGHRELCQVRHRVGRLRPGT
jgi:hypothetical protein